MACATTHHDIINMSDKFNRVTFSHSKDMKEDPKIGLHKLTINHAINRQQVLTIKNSEK